MRKRVARYLMCVLEGAEREYYDEYKQIEKEIATSNANRHAFPSENIDLEGKLRSVNSKLARISRWMHKLHRWGKL